MNHELHAPASSFHTCLPCAEGVGVKESFPEFIRLPKFITVYKVYLDAYMIHHELQKFIQPHKAVSSFISFIMCNKVLSTCIKFILMLAWFIFANVYMSWGHNMGLMQFKVITLMLTWFIFASVCNLLGIDESFYTFIKVCKVYLDYNVINIRKCV